MGQTQAIYDQSIYERAPSQQGYFIQGTILNRIMEEAPYFPHCSDNKTAQLIRPRHLAIRFPYMQVNPRGVVAWLVFDNDHAFPNRWEDAGMPPPNIIVIDRETRHSQYLYAIHPVCTTKAGRAGPIAYMKAIYTAFLATLGADDNYQRGNICKTPGHPWWRTTEMHTHVYDLGELAAYVDLERDPPWGNKIKSDKATISRKCHLFDIVRHYAYSIVNRERSSGTFDRFTRLLEAYAHNKNHFTHPNKPSTVPLSAVRSTVKSVARWTWDVYSGAGRCHRGAMRLDPDLPIPVRQRMSAERTHDVRRKATESKIRQACATLRHQGAAVTMAAVARLASLARQTVSGYKHLLSPSSTGNVLGFPAAATKGVKYGARQVTAVSFWAALGLRQEVMLPTDRLILQPNVVRAVCEVARIARMRVGASIVSGTEDG